MVIDGTAIAGEIKERLKTTAKPEGFFGAALVGDDPASVNFLKQKERIAKELKELGADIDTAVGNNTNFLITGGNGIGPSKLKKMQANIIKGKDAQIISSVEFNELKQ